MTTTQEEKPAKGIKVSPHAATIRAAVAKYKAEGLSLKEATKRASEEVRVQSAEIVDVHGLTYEVTPMPSVLALELYLTAQRSDDAAYAKHLIRIVQQSVRDPDTHELVWSESEEDMAEIRQLDPDIFGPLSAAAQRVNVGTKEADDAVGNDSGETDTADSSSASPAT